MPIMKPWGWALAALAVYWVWREYAVATAAAAGVPSTPATLSPSRSALTIRGPINPIWQRRTDNLSIDPLIGGMEG